MKLLQTKREVTSLNEHLFDQTLLKNQLALIIEFFLLGLSKYSNWNFFSYLGCFITYLMSSLMFFTNKYSHKKSIIFSAISAVISISFQIWNQKVFENAASLLSNEKSMHFLMYLLKDNVFILIFVIFSLSPTLFTIYMHHIKSRTSREDLHLTFRLVLYPTLFTLWFLFGKSLLNLIFSAK